MQLTVLGKAAIAALLQLSISLGKAQAQSSCSTLCIQNGGKCVQQFDSPSYTCDCTGTGGSAPDCSISRTASTPTPSTNSSTSSPASGTTSCPVACVHGQCLQQTDSNSQYYCSCSAGYQGSSCNTTTALPPSTSSSSSGTYTCPVPCYNGQCVQEYNTRAYKCDCSSGFSGASCSKQTTSPAPAPTAANSSASGTYTCPVACVHGQCLQQTDSSDYFCSCNAGFRGGSCNTTIAPSPSAASNSSASLNCPVSCYNGQCLKQYDSDVYYCSCSSGFTGKFCDVQTISSNVDEHGGRTLRGWKIFVIVLAAMVGVVMAASAAYIVYRHRQRQRPRTFVKFRDDEMGNPHSSSDIEIERSSSKH